MYSKVEDNVVQLQIQVNLYTAKCVVHINAHENFPMYEKIFQRSSKSFFMSRISQSYFLNFLHPWNEKISKFFHKFYYFVLNYVHASDRFFLYSGEKRTKKTTYHIHSDVLYLKVHLYIFLRLFFSSAYIHTYDSIPIWQTILIFFCYSGNTTIEQCMFYSLPCCILWETFAQTRKQPPHCSWLAHDHSILIHPNWMRRVMWSCCSSEYICVS